MFEELKRVTVFEDLAKSIEERRTLLELLARISHQLEHINMNIKKAFHLEDK